MAEGVKPYGSQGYKLAVKNKAANPIQITAEQLLREAVDRQQDEVRPPRQRILDQEELEEYRIRKRKQFEDALHRERNNLGLWIQYAEWEAGQREFKRARSVFERALGVNFQNFGTWLKYIEMEMKNKFINSARNLFDRVTQLLPRKDQFWLKYTHMEELLGNYAGARAVFERWMDWEPDDKAWLQYVRFEERCGEIERAQNVLERYISIRPSQNSFLKFAKFEEKHFNIIRARAGFEKALEVLPEKSLNQFFYIKFAQFEERQKEFDRVKRIYEEAIKRLPEDENEELYRNYVAFQKQRGDQDTIEYVVINKRRLFYEKQLLEEPQNYDIWFDLLHLEEGAGDIERIRDVYERAIAQIPPISEKNYWKRYIYLWINYALFEELVTLDIDRCRAVWDKCIEVIPHTSFSFAKVWIYYAEFEVRQLRLDRARLIFGNAIGRCKKPKIFTAYANLELRLNNPERCRQIFSKYVELHPSSADSWLAFIEFEKDADELERARYLFELSISSNVVEEPELIWKNYIDFEVENGNLDKATALYERVLTISQHYKVYKSYASFELEKKGSIKRARELLQQGIEFCKTHSLNEFRMFLINHWLLLEKENQSSQEEIDKVADMRPKIVKIRRTIVDDEGNQQGYEEATEYIFKDDSTQSANYKILEKARAWKQAQLEKAAAQQSVPVS